MYYICLFVSTSTHVLTEDVVYREVTADHRLLSRRLLMKTNRLPRWAECFFPSGMSRSVFIIEDSIVDPVNRTLTTYTWNLNHTTLMVRWQLLPSVFELFLHTFNIADIQIYESTDILTNFSSAQFSSYILGDKRKIPICLCNIVP